MTLNIERTYWNQGITNIAGVDEAGRGPLAGPVVAAAVVFPAGLLIEGINDSKKLTEKKREELFDVISSSAVTVGIGIVDHTTIDRMNILQASILAMKQAINGLQVKPGLVLADGNSFHDELVRYENLIDGDARCFSIAAASVVAKVTRDRIMVEYDKQYPEYHFAAHKGYYTREHREAIKKFGFCDIHRRSFRPLDLFQLSLEFEELDS